MLMTVSFIIGITDIFYVQFTYFKQTCSKCLLGANELVEFLVREVYISVKTPRMFKI